MKKQFYRFLVTALAAAMMMSTFCTALATGGYEPGGGEGSIGGSDPVRVPTSSGYTVTFVHGSSYDLTAQTGTTKNSDGDVLVRNVSGVISEKKIPDVAGSDAYYNVTGWAIKDDDGAMEIIDLSTYKFRTSTDVYAITEDTWPVYVDMKQNRTDWYYGYVRDLSIAGVVNGQPGYKYAPQSNVTWAESLKLVLLAVGYEVQEPTTTHWASGYLAAALKDSLVAESQNIVLDAPLTRLEFAELASKAMGLEDVNIESPFADTDAQAVLNLYDAKIVDGTLQNNVRIFMADKPISRAEIATIIWRINNYYTAQA